MGLMWWRVSVVVGMGGGGFPWQWGWVIEGDDVGRGFAGVEVGHGEVVRGELGSNVDSNETVGFFGGVVQVVVVVAVARSNWFDGLHVCGLVDGLMVCVSICV